MNSYLVNPVFFCYNSTIDVKRFAAPGALFIPSPSNYFDPVFQDARSVGGAEVFAYFHPFNLPDKLTNPNLQAIYLMDGIPLPTWKPTRSNWPGTKLIDISLTAVREHLASKLAELASKRLFDGFFLDTMGAVLWNVGWNSWPVAEQSRWITSAVELARLLWEAAKPTSSLIVHNNFWHLPPTNVLQPLARSAEAYCDGVCFELNPLSSFHTAYAGRSFAARGSRRVLVIADQDTDVDSWVTIQGITHVCLQHDYNKVVPPAVPYHDPRLPALSDLNEKLSADVLRLSDRVEKLEGGIKSAGEQAAQCVATLAGAIA